MAAASDAIVEVHSDLHSRETRARLAKMLMTLFERWGLTEPEQAGLLGLSDANRSTLARYRKGDPLGDSRDLIDRASHLLGIHESLRIIFPQNLDLAYRWMGAFNKRLAARPADVIRTRGFEGLIAVRRYLDFERGR